MAQSDWLAANGPADFPSVFDKEGKAGLGAARHRSTSPYSSSASLAWPLMLSKEAAAGHECSGRSCAIDRPVDVRARVNDLRPSAMKLFKSVLTPSSTNYIMLELGATTLEGMVSVPSNGTGPGIEELTRTPCCCSAAVHLELISGN